MLRDTSAGQCDIGDDKDKLGGPLVQGLGLSLIHI